MPTFANQFPLKRLLVRTVIVLFACGLLLCLTGPSAFMQKRSTISLDNKLPATKPAPLPEPVEQMAHASLKQQDTGDDQPAPVDEGFSKNLVTATSYPFAATTGIPLDDMSTGTTQLVAANQDDTASAVTNIGFDFWYDGVRTTQFSANANGLLRLGPTVISTGFTNSLATTTDAPKIGAYWDDLCTGANGKVHYKLMGVAPNRKLVVEWQNMQITRGSGCAGNGNGTFQAWLLESTGLIEFVYGSIQAANAVDGGYSVGLQSGAASNFASVTTNGNTVSYAAANNAQTNSITLGTAYIFTPPVPNAPTGLNFTGTTATTTTLNWTDNSSNEVGFAIYRSSNGGASYSFMTQTAVDATSFTDNTVSPATTYFYQVYAVSEGALGGPAQNSVTTNPAGNISSTAAGGNWSAPATWVGGVVPTVNDNVTIVNGSTVTIDTAAVAFTVSVGTGGTPAVLQWEPTTARTLNVGTNVNIATNGTFQSAATGTQTGHVLTVGADLTNNGTLDFSTNANTAGADLTFTSASNNSFSGSGATTNLRTLTVNKGTSSASVLDVTVSNFTVQGVNTDSAGFLNLTNGTLKISGTFTATNRVFAAASYTIGATTGFWLNNPNFIVAGQNGSPTTNGLLRITQGTFNIGTATGNSMGFASGSSIIVEGGSVNASGRFGVAAAANVITYLQSGGTITVCTIGNASTTLGSFDLGTSLTSVINFSGGTIVHQLASTGGIDYRNQAGGGINNVTGGTLQLGNAASGAAKAFVLRGVVPNLVLTNTSANHSASWSTTLVNFNNISLNITVNPGTTLNLGNVVFLFDGTTLTNNGTLTHNGASSNFVWFRATAPVNYTGIGTFTAPITNMAIQADMGLTLDPSVSNLTVGAVRLFSGSVTNANKITLGNGGATTGIVQIGNTTTPTAAGSFDVPFTFNLGTGGQTVSYLRTTLTRTTGPEINPTRTVTSMTYDDNDPTHTLVLTGGNLTCANTGTALTLTNGRVVTGGNTLSLSSGTATVTRTNGYVEGNFRKSFAAAASKNFEVGTANGFSPVTVNATAGTFPGDFTVRAVQGKLPQISGTNALQRYWTLSNNISGNVADLTFNYLATDVVGTAANYVFVKNNGGTLINNIPPAATPTTTQATINGVSAFSDWTLAESSAIAAGSFQFSSATYSDSESDHIHPFIVVVNRVGGVDGNVAVDYQVTDGTATAPDDYTVGSATGTLTWNAGDSTPRNLIVTVNGDSTFEPDETVNFALNNPQGGATLGIPNSAVLTITNDDAPVSAGQLIISEFRLRGPNPNGAQNEFIEIYNTTNTSHIVGATDGSAGYGIAASDGVLRCTIPNNTVIPPKGHFLCVNSVGYALGSYPAGNGTTATGDATYTTDIPDNAGIGLFSSATTFNLANRLDAVGSTSEANTLYKEGTGYPALTPFSIDYSFRRDDCGKHGSITTMGPCPSGGAVADTDNNAADFYFVDTNGTSAGGGQRLGAPGPENLSAPLVNTTISGLLLDGTVGGPSAPNRVRDFTSDPANNSTFGTLDIRRRIVNGSGGPITRLRFRVIDMTTFPAPSAIADLRTRTSTLVVVSGINDTATCLASNGVATTPCTVNVQGTTLEQPPSQLNGGAFGSTYSVGTVTLGTPLANGASVNVRFLLGIQQTGSFKFFINVEALP
ncbi:MAG TPA: Calx-beta domain-containing protein [Pyrinomonadaceae bacterium]|nr:Calx-beta domain-containing protein [Pyrinomonadaceae bacterium]